ncbi:hypothetical protein RG931_002662 [Pseudomonas syringae pv. actinidiae]|nr:hypothetical protein BV361_02820 [Pseudomonas syringae pv. actinidiae]OSR47627.1 hypothetical protein BV324_05554 [Pseudomonas syringae pv. actinidiae]BBM11885.1 hypothetical protein KPSA3_105659 [Pseudomonas syringae pv. actinidiae]
MTKPKTDRVKYTLEFKLEAVRLVDTGLTLAAAARSLARWVYPTRPCSTGSRRIAKAG